MGIVPDMTIWWWVIGDNNGPSGTIIGHQGQYSMGHWKTKKVTIKKMALQGTQGEMTPGLNSENESRETIMSYR